MIFIANFALLHFDETFLSPFRASEAHFSETNGQKMVQKNKGESSSFFMDMVPYGAYLINMKKRKKEKKRMGAHRKLKAGSKHGSKARRLLILIL